VPVLCDFYTEALQVSMDSADIHNMESDYQQMGTEERRRHHDDLRNDGFEWCPECGTVLVWDLPTPHAPDRRAGSAPIICGDCPPLTAEQLLATSPATH
jgi:hypothetical protein